MQTFAIGNLQVCKLRQGEYTETTVDCSEQLAGWFAVSMTVHFVSPGCLVSTVITFSVTLACSACAMFVCTILLRSWAD